MTEERWHFHADSRTVRAAGALGWRTVATVNSGEAGTGELLAAAPELLRALERHEAILRAGSAFHDPEAVELLARLRRSGARSAGG